MLFCVSNNLLPFLRNYLQPHKGEMESHLALGAKGYDDQIHFCCIVNKHPQLTKYVLWKLKTKIFTLSIFLVFVTLSLVSVHSKAIKCE